MTDPKPKRRWFQFSLRTLLLLVTLCAGLCSWVGVKIRQAKRAGEAATAIEKLGGFVRWEGSARRDWLRTLLRIETVTCVGFDHKVKWEYLQPFNELQQLHLENSQINDAGLGHIEGLGQLEELYLCGTPVTDAGLEHLNRLSQLKILWLNGTKVDDAGLKHLKGLNRLESLFLDGTNITDAGLEHLLGLKNLQWLGLNGTHVTAAGIEKLRQVIPDRYITSDIDGSPGSTAR